MEKQVVVAAGAPQKKSFAAKAKALGSKAGAVVMGSLVSASAFAQSGDTPATLDGAAAFMTTKGAIAIAVAAAITLIILGLTGAKLPRRGT